MTDITHELISGGFCWERKKSEPVQTWLTSVKKRKPGRRKDPAYLKEYRRKQRAKWAAMGIIKGAA